MNANFFELVGQTIRKIDVRRGDEAAVITTDNLVYCIYHSQNCCENVRIFEIKGDKDSILDQPVLLAEEDDQAPEMDKEYCYDSSHTWTKFTLKTASGQFTFWFLGESNGYYSEAVSISKESV